MGFEYMNKYFRISLIVLMAISLIVGVPLVIISHSSSPYRIIEKKTFELNYNTTYRYVAEVNKSIIYYNRETIGMDEPLYIPLTKSLNFSINFNVDVKHDSIINNKGLLELRIRLIEPEGWSILLYNKTYVINSTNEEINFTINITEIRDIISNIRKEIGSSSLEYDIEIDPLIKLSTRISKGIIDRMIEPKLILKLDFQRNKILYDKLNFTDSYKKTDKEIVASTMSILGLAITVQNLRYISYGLILVGVASIILMMITRERTFTNVVESFIRKYDNIIIKASKITASSRKVLVKDFKELLRISRLLGKPIVYYKEGDSHIFTVIDAETLYILSLNDEGKPI